LRCAILFCIFRLSFLSCTCSHSVATVGDVNVRGLVPVLSGLSSDDWWALEGLVWLG
jgi:hypothetical protein